MPLPQSTAYGWLMLAGIAVSILFWSRLARRDSRLVLIYVAALTGAFLGAKIIYLLAEGWLHFGAEDFWLQIATGKSVLGALLGGYAAVEAAKKFTGYAGVTGDWFATIAPLGILLGRVGCLLHGCCLGRACDAAWFTLADNEGVARWPAVPVEIGFNAACLVALLALRRAGKFPGQHFHLYLIAYGLFRFVHEFLRDTPRVFAGLSGYQFAALACAALGAWRFRQRRAVVASPG
ncbi:MAG: prolipoprotein diacylglyceryl transferase [Verrucomicrobia bacterium]|nr:prolipoprotein diacylglyceryl transferase [Verrucomicrobiota bacterium]